jgi:tRNA threonylcarbamoyladenosine biosynthesis protein TsaE
LSSIEIGRHVPPIVETPVSPAPSLWRGRWTSEADTQAFAARLAACPAIHNATLTLQGDLGAGKTTFVRHLLRALGVRGRIKSPTYAVVEPHSAADGPLAPTGAPLAIWHFDFYRFTDPREWEDAGFRELFASPGLKLVEWPERAAGLMPAVDADIHIEPEDTMPIPSDEDTDSPRSVSFTAHTPTGQLLLSALQP